MQSFLNFLVEQETDPSIVGPMITTRDYANRMLEQGKKFLKYGRESDEARAKKGKAPIPGYDPKYDYGGEGDIGKDMGAYRRVGEGVVQGMMRDKGIKEDQLDDAATRERLVERYRGATRKQDPRYFGEFDKTFKSGSTNCVGAFCDAIEQAETGGQKARGEETFIRTTGVPGSSSSAYGPMQITASTLGDMVNRHSDLFPDKDPREK